MLFRKKINVLKTTTFTVFLTLLICFAGFAKADNLEKLVTENPSNALQELNKKLETNPEDREMLFFKARAHENLDDTDSASQIYRALIKRYPDQPEPYLNLAKIYADNGSFKAAREVLEQGFNSNKVYSEMYQSVKKLNSHLASQAYLRALNKDVPNESPDLLVAKNLAFPEMIIKEVEVIKEVKVPVEVIKEVEVVKEVKVPVTSVAQAEPTQSSTLNPTQTAAEPNQINSTLSTPNIIETVKSWAQVWSKQDVSQYISFYAPDYSSRGKNRTQWIADRKIKIGNKQFIEVKVSDFDQKLTNKGVILVSFSQSYRSDTIFDTVRKQLTFKNFPSGWKIVNERIIGR